MAYRVLFNDNVLSAEHEGMTLEAAKVAVIDMQMKLVLGDFTHSIRAFKREHLIDFTVHHHGGFDVITIEEC